MPTLLSFFHRMYFDQRWIAAMDPQQVEVEASVVIPTDICLLLIRAFMHYCSMEHFQISGTLLLVDYNWHFDLHILCTCDVPQFVIYLRRYFDVFLLTAHALR